MIDNLAKINTNMAEYTKDWQTMINSSSSWTTRKPAPRHSRWAFLVGGVDAFVKVLEGTDQEAISEFHGYPSAAAENDVGAHVALSNMTAGGELAVTMG